MKNLLEGRRAVVTGAAQGIGEGIAQVLSICGATVAVVDLQSEGKGEASRDIRGPRIVADLTSEKDCRAAVEQAGETLGGIDILVNNAAPRRDRETIGNLDATDWSDHSKIVLEAVQTLVSASVDLMKPGSSIVNVSSVTSSQVQIEQCGWSYHVSKAGLDQFTLWLAVLLGPKGIRVNAVAPSLVDRDYGRKLTDDPVARKIIEDIVPLGRAASAREVGNAVAFLSSEMASYITGQVLVLDGGLESREVFGAAWKAVLSQSRDRDA